MPAAHEVRRGEIVIGERHVKVDRTFALPVLRGPALAGLPADQDGYLPIDAHGHVVGVTGVFAAGDVTNFPLKQGGLAAQQAEAVAEAVAARHGCALEPEPFRPVLRGKLLTAGGDLYMQNEIAGGAGEGRFASRPLWWPPTKIVARRLGPYLFGSEKAERIQGAGTTELSVG